MQITQELHVTTWSQELKEGFRELASMRIKFAQAHGSRSVRRSLMCQHYGFCLHAQTAMLLKNIELMHPVPERIVISGGAGVRQSGLPEGEATLAFVVNGPEPYLI